MPKLPLKIAFLNPYLGRAEDQAAHSLRAAAQTLGFELTPIAPSDLSETSPFDMVISTTTALRKTTSHPTFLSVHLPRVSYVEDAAAFENLISYDGYFSISESLEPFLQHLSAGTGKRIIEPARYYNAPQATDLQTDVADLAFSKTLQLCYFGTNWEPRSSRLFRRLCRWREFRLYGPEGAWDGFPAGSYKGAVPFDGVAVQREYARWGAGLVSLSSEHLIDDVISNRLLEIASVGACAICPDTPWIREHFGDSVWYYRAFADDESIVGDIAAGLADIRRDPAGAQSRAKAARNAFEGRFDAATLLSNAANYLSGWRAVGEQRHAAVAETAVDVIVRVGGRPVDIIREALDSLDAQSAGRFRVIFVAYRPIDLECLLGYPWQRITGFEVVEAPGANRGRAMAAGLKVVRSPYFAILDDDDYLLADHFAGLLCAIEPGRPGRRFAYADILRLDESAPAGQRFSLLKAGPGRGDIHALMERFSSHCFLADSASLAIIRFDHWALNTGEDALLVLALLRVSEPVHVPEATAVYRQGRGDSSAFLDDPDRPLDEMALHLEAGPWRTEIEARFPADPQDLIGFVAPSVRAAVEPKRKAVSGGVLISNAVEIDPAQARPAPAPVDGADVFGGGFGDDLVFLDVPLTRDRVRGAVTEEGRGLRTSPQAPWAFAVSVKIGDFAIQGVTTMAVLCYDSGAVGAWVNLIDARGEILARTQAPAREGRTLAVMLAAPDGVALPEVALQAGVGGAAATFVRGASMAFRFEELKEAFSLEDRAAIKARLTDRFERQLVGEPPADPDAVMLQPIDFRAAGNVFRTALHDGPLSEGAPRTISTGEVAWDYFTQIRLPPAAGAYKLHLRLANPQEAFSALIVDSLFEQVTSSIARIIPGKRFVSVWLDARAEGGWLVFQAGEAPRARPFVLLSLEAGGGELSNPLSPVG